MNILENCSIYEAFAIGYGIAMFSAYLILVLSDLIKLLINRIAPVQINGGK